MNTLLRNAVVAALALTLALCAFVGVFSADFAAPCEYSAEAVTAAGKDGAQSDLLWYYGENALNLPALRKQAAENLLPVLVRNDVDPVVIAVVDTGIYAEHELFKGVLAERNGETSAYNSNPDSKKEGLENAEDRDEEYHGTAVAGIIAMLIRELGLQNYVKILPIKASYTNSEKKESFKVESVTEAIRYAVSVAGADVVNLSLGIQATDDKKAQWRDNSALLAAVAEASREAVLVAAAGNNGRSSEKDAFYPAALDGILGVMATGTDGEARDNTNYGDGYDMFAPGEEIRTAAGGAVDAYTQTDGTSMAAPFVSFGAALLRLRFEAENAEHGAAVPRAAAQARLLRTKGDSDTAVKAVNGKEYKSLSLVNLLTADFGEIGYSETDGISVTARDADGGLLDIGGDSPLTLTIRKNQALLNLYADLLPLGDTDPVLDAKIEWRLTPYALSEDGETETDGTPVTIGTGAEISYKFTEEGYYKVRASVTLDNGDTYYDEFRVRAKWSEFYGHDAFIVPLGYLESDTYLDGADGAIPHGATLYGGGKSISLSVTTIENVKPGTVRWYVNGRPAAQGNVFEFAPDKFGRYEITAEYVIDNTTHRIQSGFIVLSRSWAASPSFVPVWVAAGIVIAIIAFAAYAFCMRREQEKHK